MGDHVGGLSTPLTSQAPNYTLAILVFAIASLCPIEHEQSGLENNMTIHLFLRCLINAGAYIPFHMPLLQFFYLTLGKYILYGYNYIHVGVSEVGKVC